jgi:hypothetical protein
MKNEENGFKRGLLIFLGVILVLISFYCWSTLDGVKEIETPLWQTSLYVSGGLGSIMAGIALIVAGVIKVKKD